MKVTIESFDEISISGRYLYAFLCLDEAIRNFGNPLPQNLFQIIAEFSSSDDLAVWQEKVDEFRPSWIMDEHDTSINYIFLSKDEVSKLRVYYEGLPDFIIQIIENIIDTGVSNLYGGFSSSFTLPYIKKVILLMIDHKLSLPGFDLVAKMSVNQNRGWGDRSHLMHFIK